MFKEFTQTVSSVVSSTLPSEDWSKYITMWTATLLVGASIYFSSHAWYRGGISTKLSTEEIATVTLILNDTTVEYTARRERAVNYMLMRMNPRDTVEVFRFRAEISLLNTTQLVAAMPILSVSSKSFFWLNSDWKYFEVIFWSIFGIIANLLYKSSEAVGQGSFAKKEDLPLYTAKLYYSPLVALVIIFSVNLLSKNNEVHVDNTSHELLVFSFVLGFFSSRAIELLNKFKDVLMPGGKGEETQAATILTGKVEPPRSTPAINVEDVEVTLTSLQGQVPPLVTKTNKDGVYFFKDVQPGDYVLQAKVMDEGLGTFSATVDQKKITKGASVDVENLILKKE